MWIWIAVSLLLWFALAPLAGIVLGRGMRLRDEREQLVPVPIPARPRHASRAGR
jgi:hypothetical protein